MKKIISYLILIIALLLVTLVIILSTKGVKTKKFNNLISDKVSQTKNVNLKLDVIKFKIDVKEISLFLETQNPKVTYRNVFIPVQNIKVYVDFLSLLKSNFKIKKSSVKLKELDIEQLKKLSIAFKPSNFKSLLNNKIKEGKIISEIEIFLNDQGTLENFISKGKVKGLKVQLLNDLNFSRVNLSFFADRNDILIKNISGDIADIKISDGDIKLNFENGIKLNSNFISKINYDEKLISKYSKFLKKYNLDGKIKNLKADLNNNLTVDLDKTYKVKDYNYSISANLEKSKFEISEPIKNDFIKEEIKKIYLSDSQIKIIFKPKFISWKCDGKYSFNNSDFLKINLENNFKKDLIDLKLNLDYGNNLNLDLINYKKKNNSISNLYLDLIRKKNYIKINKFNYYEGNNFIKLSNFEFNENILSSFKKIEVKTPNNDFNIINNKKILINGNKFDATQLAKFFSNQNDKSRLEKISGNVEIDFKNIYVPLSEKLSNFKLIGEIKKGKFIKISSKGDFGDNNYLDITMKKDKNSNKKYLEIYSDLTRPLLTEYSFFSGLSGGKLLFTSVIDEAKSNSKLVIEDFKVVNAPGIIKLLSLADLGGLADIAEGEGLSFEILEIEMEKNKNFLKLNEILALGPSMSVLMEGYQDGNGLTSLRGTLVPAKTLNKMISKIPVIGNIVIPKEVGEGLFGVSFKMKGPKGKMKTTINPLKTLTPRFIQKIIEKNKTTK